MNSPNRRQGAVLDRVVDVTAEDLQAEPGRQPLGGTVGATRRLGTRRDEDRGHLVDELVSDSGRPPAASDVRLGDQAAARTLRRAWTTRTSGGHAHPVALADALSDVVQGGAAAPTQIAASTRTTPWSDAQRVTIEDEVYGPAGA